MTAIPGKPPRGVTVGGRAVSNFPDPPWASYEEFAAWQASFKVEDPPLAVGGYRDNPKPAPSIEWKPRWWERLMRAIGICR